jgi:hypothetical protein
MAVVGSALAEDIVAAFAPRMNYSDPTRFNRQWLNALCDGFASMWQAGLMTLGAGPPPAGSYSHIHTVTVLDPVTMSTPPKAIVSGPQGRPDTFVDVVSNQVSAFLIANTVMDLQEGSVLHAHLFTSFGVANALSDQITSALQATGLFNVAGSFLPVWIQGFSSALLAHMQTNADMTQFSGANHVHALL